MEKEEKPYLPPYQELQNYAHQRHITLPDTLEIKKAALQSFYSQLTGETMHIEYRFGIQIDAQLNDFRYHSNIIDSLYNQFIVYKIYLDNLTGDYRVLLNLSIFGSKVYPNFIGVAYNIETKELFTFNQMDWDMPQNRTKFQQFVSKCKIKYNSRKEYVQIMSWVYGYDFHLHSDFTSLQSEIHQTLRTSYYDCLYDEPHILQRGDSIQYTLAYKFGNLYILTFHNDTANEYDILPIVLPYSTEFNYGDIGPKDVDIQRATEEKWRVIVPFPDRKKTIWEYLKEWLKRYR